MKLVMPKSFFGQLVLGTFLMQTLLLGLFIWYTVITQRTSADQHSKDRIVRQLGQLAAACSEDLAEHDMGSLQNALEISRIAPTIEVARLTDLKGETLAVTESGKNRGLDSYELAVLPKATRQQIFRIRNDQMEAVTPVLKQGQPAALLWLEPNPTAVQSTIGVVVRIALSYGGFALLANLLPVFLIVRSITRPLNTLRNATDSVMRDPDLRAGFPLPVTTHNEAGDLTVSFNAMVHELEVQRRDLLETLALMDSMLSNAPIGFAFVDRDLRYIRVNEFLAKLHDISAEEHMGKRPADVYPEAIGEAKADHIREVFETGVAVRNVELSGEMPHAPGVRRSWLMHFYPVRTTDDVVRWVGVIVIEVTDRLKAEEALRRTEKLAAAGRLAASIAHEINNPLEAVTNLLYILRMDDSLDASSAMIVSTAEAELARVSEITQQTLRFYRQSTLPSRVNVADILNSIAILYQRRVASASIKLVRKFRGEPEIFGFGGELRQLFANLIGNAIDAMPSGGVLQLGLHSGHGFNARGSWCHGVHVYVADNGTGMSKETRNRIFEAFYTTKEATGTGLGLWVSEEIVAKHCGVVRVKSRQGKSSGTIFRIFLPDADVTNVTTLIQ